MLRNVEIFRVIKILIRSSLDPIDDSWLQINQKCSRNIVFIVGLVEKDVFAVVSLNSEIFQDSLGTDTMLLTQVLPEFVSN
jgi:hypothetical protein